MALWHSVGAKKTQQSGAGLAPGGELTTPRAGGSIIARPAGATMPRSTAPCLAVDEAVILLTLSLHHY